MNSFALKGHTNNSHGFQPMGPANREQIRTLEGSTNRASALVGPFRAGQDNWVDAVYHGLKTRGYSRLAPSGL